MNDELVKLQKDIKVLQNSGWYIAVITVCLIVLNII